jgi:thymidylate synthase ThyX
MTTPEIEAELLLASQNPLNGEKVYTFVVEVPKYINAEVMTHGNLSINASSSRAIGFPITKLQGNTPFIPPIVQKPAKSMYGTNEVDYAVYQEFKEDLSLIFNLTKTLLTKFEGQVHKQHLNRYIEAFTMQTMVITGNHYAWLNFFKLRDSEFADPNICVLAKLIKGIFKNTVPRERYAHIPMVNGEDWEMLLGDEMLVGMLSAGRIARVSYNNHQKLESIQKSLDRAKMLKDSCHASCFTHQLYADIDKYGEGITHQEVGSIEDYYSGNAFNWVQLRKLIWQGLQ